MIREWETIDLEMRRKIEPFLQLAPVRVAGMARELGLEVKVATLRAGISGQIQRSDSSPSGYRIRINRHEVSTRQRFTIAHEIAHYLLHRDAIGAGIEDTVLYRSSLPSAREAEANRLAAELVMPKLLVSRERSKNGSLSDPELVHNLAVTFNVSEAAMSIRLGISQ